MMRFADSFLRRIPGVRMGGKPHCRLSRPVWLYLPSAATLFAHIPRFLRRHRLMTGWMRLTGESPVQLVRIRDGAYGFADLGDGFLRLIVIEGEFEDDFFRIASALLGDGGVFFDVGANFGLMSFGLAHEFGARVDCHLFEPNERLRVIIAQTACRYPGMRIRLNPEAVCDDDNATVAFLVDEQQTGHSRIVAHGGVAVPAIRLDSYIDQHGIEQVDLLKIDIEGRELAALRGARNALQLHKIKAIYFEYYEKWLGETHPPEELIGYLRSQSYEVCLCRTADLVAATAVPITIRTGLPGHGLPLVPVTTGAIPAFTDLLAIPVENLGSF